MRIQSFLNSRSSPAGFRRNRWHEQLHPFCNNANAAIRRSVWVKHPYNETLTGLEDLAWAKEARAERIASWLMWLKRKSSTCTRKARSECLTRYRREAMAFKQIFPEAHFNLYDFARNTLTSIGFDLFHAARKRKLCAQPDQHFLVPYSTILGNLPGLPSFHPAHTRSAPDVLLPRWLGEDGFLPAGRGTDQV